MDIGNKGKNPPTNSTLPPAAVAFHNIAAMELGLKVTALQKLAKEYQSSTDKRKQQIGKNIGSAANTLAQAVTDLKAINQ